MLLFISKTNLENSTMPTVRGQDKMALGWDRGDPNQIWEKFFHYQGHQAFEYVSQGSGEVTIPGDV